MTVTVVVCALVNVHDNVAVPLVVTLVGVTEHAPLLTVKLTVPVKPFW